MNNFEATVLISPNLSKNDLNSISVDFEKSINEHGGSILAKEDWGLRDLAYKIKTLKKAFYFYYQLNIDGRKVANLKKIISQNEQILRYLFIKVETHQELPTKLLKEKE